MQPGQIIESLFDLYLTDEYARDYHARLSALRALYEGYSTATQETKEILNQLLTAHASYCKQQGKTELLREHNTFVLRYVAGYSAKEIARNFNGSLRTVFRDISAVFDNLMLLAFGVDGLKPTCKGLSGFFTERNASTYPIEETPKQGN